MRSVSRSLIVQVRRLVLIALAIASVGLFDASSASAETPLPVETNCPQYTDSVVRLYTAAFGRQPEAAGFSYWVGEYQEANHTLSSMAEFFANSPELTATYGSLSDGEYVERLYRNVLGRAGDTEGVEFWTGQLSSNSRGDVLLRFSESPENVTRSGTVEPALGFYNVGHDGPFHCLYFSDDFFVSPDRAVECRSFYGAVQCHSTDSSRMFVGEPLSPDCRQMAIGVSDGGPPGWSCAALVYDHAVEDYAFIAGGPTKIYVEDSVVECSLDVARMFCQNWDIFGFTIEDNQVETWGFS